MRVVFSVFESLPDGSPPCESDRTVEIRAFKKSVTRCRHQWGSPDAHRRSTGPSSERRLSVRPIRKATTRLPGGRWRGRPNGRWRINPDAAASLREGLEETLTVVRLGVPGALRRTLATTNPIESALSVTRRVTARVTRWRDGDMRQRWYVAGLLRAESKFRRVKGHRAMPTLLKALESLARGQPAGSERDVA